MGERERVAALKGERGGEDEDRKGKISRRSREGEEAGMREEERTNE